MFTYLNRDLLHLTLAGIIWLVTALCAVSSLYSQTRLPPRRRRIWLAIILGLPLLGVLLYLPFSLDNPRLFSEWYNKIFPGRED